MTWTTWIGIEGEDTTNEKVRGLYDRVRSEKTGKVPDLVRLTSRTPEVAGLIHDLSIAVYQRAKGLTLREKEIVALISSSYIGCVH